MTSTEYSNIPDELKQRKQWVCWRLETVAGKETKVPYQVDGNKAESSTSDTWNTFEAVCAAVPKRRFNGIGFVVSEDDPYTFVDLDHVITDGEITPAAAGIVHALDSYTEYSHSGTGLHIFVKASKPGIRCKSAKLQTEIYDSGRYAIFTGNLYPGAPVEINERQEALATLYNTTFSKQQDKSPLEDPPVKQSTQITITGGLSDDNDLLQAALVAKNGDKFRRLWNGDISEYGGDDSAADQALCNILAFWTGKDEARMDRLFRQSGLMREKWNREDYRSDTIWKACEDVTETYSGRRTQSTGVKLKTANTPDTTTGYHCTDVGNAERFISQHGDNVRYVADWKQWILWTGTRWQLDEAHKIEALAKKTARSIYAEAAAEESDNRRKELVTWARTSENAQRVTGMLLMARSDLAILSNALDTDKYLLGAKNGTLDLRTGILKPARREDFITKQTDIDYDPEATCPTWTAFLERVQPDPDTRRYIQQCLGYSLSGDTSERCIFFLYGLGANGKSTTLEILKQLVGSEYFKKIDSELLMYTSARNAAESKADLIGKRVVSTTEIGDKQRLNEALIKDLSGGDTQDARKLYCQSKDFTVQFKIWLYGNYKPTIRGKDFGIWSRIRLIPFFVTIPDAEQDKHLTDKLHAELPGILAWAVRGCLDWQKNGLRESEAVKNAINEYRKEQDNLSDFLSDCCIFKRESTVSKADLWSEYQRWNTANGDEAYTAMRYFNADIKRRNGVTDTKLHGGVRAWRGIGLKTPDDKSSEDYSFGDAGDGGYSKSCKIVSNFSHVDTLHDYAPPASPASPLDQDSTKKSYCGECHAEVIELHIVGTNKLEYTCSQCGHSGARLVPEEKRI